MPRSSSATTRFSDRDHTNGATDHRDRKIDLGEAWTQLTGLPFVYAFWAGRPDALTPGARAGAAAGARPGVVRIDAIAREYFRGSPALQDVGARYLRDNIKYHLGADERAGLELFYRYAAEAGVVPAAAERFC